MKKSEDRVGERRKNNNKNRRNRQNRHFYGLFNLWSRGVGDEIGQK